MFAVASRLLVFWRTKRVFLIISDKYYIRKTRKYFDETSKNTTSKYHVRHSLDFSVTTRNYAVHRFTVQRFFLVNGRRYGKMKEDKHLFLIILSKVIFNFLNIIERYILFLRYMKTSRISRRIQRFNDTNEFDDPDTCT